MTEQQIKDWLNKYDLDLRKTKDGTALDMKDTPDIVSYIADCIVHFADDATSSGIALNDVRFSVADIWHTQYAIDTAVQVFGKPSPDSPKAIQEYNKLFTLPIKALLYARVLSTDKKGRSYIFSIRNYELLDYIASRDGNAAKFLALYFKKVLEDSGIYRYFDIFLQDQTKVSLSNARTLYAKFNQEYKIKGQKGGSNLESNKTFIKLINIMAYDERKCGIAKGGGVTDAPISLQHIRYNAPNSRDLANGKPKGLTRTEHEVSPAAIARTEYAINRAKQRVDKYNQAFNAGLTETMPMVIRGRKNNCIDMAFEVNASRQNATDKHHIFPAAEFPEISTYFENIICITPEQHLNIAHPSHDTHAINRMYQYYLILCKMERIMLNVIDGIGTPDFYSFRKFTKVLDVGLRTEEFERVSINDFDTVSTLIDSYY